MVWYTIVQEDIGGVGREMESFRMCGSQTLSYGINFKIRLKPKFVIVVKNSKSNNNNNGNSRFGKRINISYNNLKRKCANENYTKYHCLSGNNDRWKL